MLINLIFNLLKCEFFVEKNNSFCFFYHFTLWKLHF